MRPILLALVVLVAGCAPRRVTVAPSAAPVRNLMAKQQAGVVEAATGLREQAVELRKLKTGNDRIMELADYIDYKASLLLKDYRPRTDRHIPET